MFTLQVRRPFGCAGFLSGRVLRGEKLGRRAVLMIGDQRNRPLEPLPPEMIAVDYAPFESLLELACVVVHHGIGTTSQGLRAGCAR